MGIPTDGAAFAAPEVIHFAEKRIGFFHHSTPPLGNVIDGAIIAQRCDGAILLVESGALSYRLVQKAKRQLERTGCRILGAVLNRVDMAGSGYYHRYYGKYSKYTKYYENWFPCCPHA